MQIRWLGHAAFALESEATTVLIDPFLTGNPKAVASADEVPADAIVLTHAHGDHVGDTVAIAERTGAAVVAITELAGELAQSLPEGHPVHNPNLGGTVALPWGSVRLVPAWHTSTSAGGRTSTPVGVLIEIGARTIYHLGDTALFSDLALPRARGAIDVALMCIGGHFTMDRHDAVLAAELVGADTVIPCHYGTFPAIDTDANAFKADVEAAGHAKVAILAPGEALTL
jgi:L-ascorbate metabolism protein UlaG (beta-lactamase superfamily)